MRDSETRRFNIVEDFSLERNPNGPWSYGSAGSPGEFVRFSERQNDPMGATVKGWSPGREVLFPDLRRNFAGKQLLLDGALLPEDALILRPGHRLLHQTTYSVVRFTAPGRGAYRLRGRFEAVSIGYGGTTQLILEGGRKLAENQFINAHGLSWEFDLQRTLARGAWVDLMISNSPNGDNSNDCTGLTLTVEWNPGVSPLWMGGVAGAALAGIVAWRRRRGIGKRFAGTPSQKLGR